MMRPDLLCIGESMALLAPTPAAPLQLDSALTLQVGGAESNTAIAASAHGVRAAWASLLGVDHLGDLVEEAIRARGVDTSLVRRRLEPTGLYLKNITPRGTQPIYYRVGSAAAHMDAACAAQWARGAEPRIVHVSGITAQISASGRELLSAVCERRVFGDALVSFDVNHRPALAGHGTADALLRFARAADIVFVGADEAAAVWGVEPAGIPPLIGDVRHLIVKDAENTAVEYTGGAAVERAAHTVDVIEPVGAGDAFAGGWLAALLSGADAGQRLESGHACARRALLSPTDTIDAAASDLSPAPELP